MLVCRRRSRVEEKNSRIRGQPFLQKFLLARFSNVRKAKEDGLSEIVVSLSGRAASTLGLGVGAAR